MLLALLFLYGNIAFGQGRITVSGTVSDASGSPLSRASVKIKGSVVGTVTDEKGSFSLTALPKDVLVISSVGYEQKEIPVGNETVFTISLATSSSNLEGVVVTALGIKKQARSLGYAVSTITAKDITMTGSTNFASALYGKAAGVKITTAPGGATSAVNVQIRGLSSINGNTQPLYVVDGVPIRLYNNLGGNNNALANNGGYWAEQRIQGNGVLDINPDDIESISILKGASASALYGSEAINGVVVITTKKGTKGKGLGVDVNYVVNQEKLAFSPDYQNEYGPGYDKLTNLAYGAADGWITDADGSMHPRYRDYGQFGPKFDGRTVRYWDGSLRPYVAQPNNYKDFFQTGYNSSANVALSGAGDKGSFRLSYSRMDYKGIQRGGKLGKNYFNFNSTLKLSDRVSVDLVSSYINSLTHNRPTLMSRVFSAFDGFFSRMDDMNTILNKFQTSKGYEWVAYDQPYDDNEKLFYNYRAVELLNLLWDYRLKNSYDENQDRFINSATLNVGILNNLKFRGRVGGDFTSLNIEDKQYSKYPSSFGYSGNYGVQGTRYNIFYGDALLTYNNKITKDLDFTLTGGITGRQQKFRYQKTYTKDGLVDENFFSLTNTANTNYSANEVTATRGEDVYFAEFGTLALDYKNFLYVEATGRHEATSTLPPASNSYFYPSINSGFILSDVTTLPSFINYAKLRASYGITGNHPDAYMSNVAYGQLSNTYSTGTALSQYPSSNNPFGNDNLKSEKKSELEFGLEARLFHSKLGVDVSYYNNKVSRQILNLTVPTSTGANSQITNIGDLSNSGVEIAFNATPVTTKDFRWDTRINFAFNKNKLTALQPGQAYLDNNSQDGGWLLVRSYVGEALGNIYVHPIATDGKGNNIVGGDGLYVIDNNSYKKVGNIQPKMVGGFSNTVSYKDFSLDFMMDYRFGGQLVSVPHYYMEGAGMFKSTLKYRDAARGGLAYNIDAGSNLVQSASGVYHDGLILPGVTTSGGANTTLIDAGTYYLNTLNWESGTYEKAVFDNSYIKLRELAVSYKLPQSLATKLHFQSLQFSLVGRNLFYIWKTIPDLDPEVAVGSSWVSQGIDGGSTAPTRSIGATLRARF